MNPLVYLLNGQPVFSPPGGGGNWAVNNLTVAGNETVGGSLSVSGALTAPDLTLGSGGPSVKSSLDARAPRQGLVFDGTGNTAQATLGSTIGTSDFTWTEWFTVPSNPAVYSAFGGIATSGSYLIPGSALQMSFQATGALRVSIPNAGNTGGVYADVAGFSGLIGKLCHLSVSRSGSTLTVYVNGISQTVTPLTYGSSPGDFSNTVSGTYVSLAGSGGGSGTQYVGTRVGPYIYNRALSASEVVSLFEAGVPAGADYNATPASNTNLSNATITGNYTITGATATGFTASSVDTTFRYAYSAPFTIKAGNKYLVTYTLTLNSGSIPAVELANPAIQNYGYNSGAGTGAQSIVMTANTNASNARVVFDGAAATNFTVSNLTIIPLGLLLAPEAAQPGNGLVWTDLSGNGAQIVLPTSGVAWNVPGTPPTRVRGTTSTNGNQILLGNYTILAQTSVNRVRARARTGTPTVKLGTAAGAGDTVAAVTLSTSWQNLTILAGNQIMGSNIIQWVNSNSTDVVEWDIELEPLAF